MTTQNQFSILIDSVCWQWLLVICLACFVVSLTGCGRRAIREPESIADRLPPGVEIIREFNDRSGMDAFFLWKATFGGR
jgi:hypothetical protein